MKKKVLLGMSGGVDSTAAALLLKESGYEVVGVTYRLTDDRAVDDNIEDARRAAAKLGIEYMVADYRDVFERCVISNFVNEYAAGHTPNPCVVCNKHIKYGEFLKTADEVGAYYVSTGQYAVVRQHQGRYHLVKPVDRKKDQTYFLYTLREEVLPRIVFPMGSVKSKESARQLLKEAGIELYGKRDSQEICFIKDVSYGQFLRSRITAKPGDFTDREGNILGRHQGIINYTVGQRKGLGIALGKPAFVTCIDASANRVVLGDDEDLFTREILVRDLTFVNDEYAREKIRLGIKIRYAAKEVPATVCMEGKKARILFDEPVRAATAGQSAVFYDGDILAGGGIIE